MNLSISLIIDNENRFCEKYDIIEDFDGNAKLIITTNLEQSYIKVISDYKKIKHTIKNIYKRLQATNINNELISNIEFIKNFLKLKEQDLQDLIEKNEDIYIMGRTNEIKKYIEKNIQLSNKKIIITQRLKLEDKITYVINEMFKNAKNVYVRLEGNKEPISISNLNKTLNIIDCIIEDVKRFNFSPLEQIMYVYDKVRNRVYKEEDATESNCISRDLTQILLGNKIVCEGFANEFNAILKKLGFKASTYSLLKKELVNNKKVGHIRNMVYINDKKYNVKGIYYFDTTWDSKRKENNDNYLLSYNFFAKTKKEIESHTKDLYVDNTLPSYDNTFIYKFSNIIKNKGLKNVPKEMIDTINTISRFIDGESLISPLMIASFTMHIPECLNVHFDFDEVMNKLVYYDSLFESTIYAETLLKVLYNVRKNEYYQEPNNYPFSINALYSVLINSNWIFKSNASSLLMAIFGCEAGKKLIEDTKINMRRYIKKEELDKKVEQIKLIKVLKDVYEKR